MTCDHNVSEPQIICKESHNYYYLNSILYAQKKGSANETDIRPIPSNQNSSKGWSLPLQNNRKEPVFHSNVNISEHKTEEIFPFKGFNSLKSISSGKNQTNQKLFQMKSNKTQIEINSENEVKPSIGDISSDKMTFLEIPANNSMNNSLNNTMSLKQIDWDDEQTDIKLLERPQEFHVLRPTFNEVVNPINLATVAPIPLPALPVPLMKQGPLVFLRPNYIPGTLPIATLYKQTEYLYGKPPIVHKGLYFNPSFGAAIVNQHSLTGSHPLFGPMGPINLIPSPSTHLNSKFTKNSKLFPNFSNALTKFSLNDIFGLRIPLSPKRKGSDKSIDSILNYSQIFNPLFDKIDLATPDPSPAKSHPYILPINQNLYLNNKINANENNGLQSIPRIYFEENIPLNYKKQIDSNESPLDLIGIDSKTIPTPDMRPKREKYSLKLDEITDSSHIIIQPSVFTNSDKRKKWIENYAKIKKKYIEREKKSLQNNRRTQRRKYFENYESIHK